MKTRVYIAGPMTKGNIAENLRQAKRACVALIKAGYAPLCPQLTQYIDPGGIFPHQTWADVDLPWVAVSHAVLRLPGESKGADQEVACARSRGIPVFDHLSDLLDHLRIEMP
jgi:hypothetical protein